MIGTSFLGREGKARIYNHITFSSSQRRSTLTEGSGGGGEKQYSHPQFLDSFFSDADP
jgi:hypothetical protein